jgi:hypothetical protein
MEEIMAEERVPPGAFPECEMWEQQLATQSLGGMKSAFTSRKDSLTKMRTAINEHDVDIAAMKETLANLPFPFAVHS